MNKKISIVTVMILALSFSGCANIFSASAKKDTDEAIFEDAQKYVDSADYDNALLKFALLSSSYQARTEVKETWAATYAGKCGLNFITFFNALSSTSLSGTTFFKYLMNTFTGSTIYPSYCDLAQAKIEEIGTTSSSRSTSQNMFMAILGMAKIGTYLRSIADVTENGGLGDGSVDGTYDSCNTGSMSDTNLDQIIVGMGLITDNSTALTTVLGAGTISTSLTQISTVCGASCQRTSTSAITQPDRDMFRDILKTGSANTTAPLGIESCANVLVSPCC